VKDRIAEMQAEVDEAVVTVKCQYLQLAAAIMRECGDPWMADSIDQQRYLMAKQMRDKRKNAEAKPDIAKLEKDHDTCRFYVGGRCTFGEVRRDCERGRR